MPKTNSGSFRRIDFANLFPDLKKITFCGEKKAGPVTKTFANRAFTSLLSPICTFFTIIFHTHSEKCPLYVATIRIKAETPPRFCVIFVPKVYVPCSCLYLKFRFSPLDGARAVGVPNTWATSGCVGSYGTSAALIWKITWPFSCLLYTSDAADE